MDYVDHSGRRRVIYESWEMWICIYATLRGGGNAALKKGTGLCDFKPILGMQIRRPGMRYVSKRKLEKLLCYVA